MIFLDDASLLALLKEDAPYGDLTSRSLDLHKAGKMRFQTRIEMTVCGVEEAARLLTLIGCQVSAYSRSGDFLEAAEPILEVTGPAESLLLGWKVAQTLVEWASGVATMAKELVDTAQAVNPQIIVACTRKAIPGTRLLSAKAILAGGASLHRTGLSDSLLLFPEHRFLATGVDVLVKQIATLKSRCPEKQVVVEVTSPQEAIVAQQAGADVLQLEKFTPMEVTQLMAQLPNQTKVAVAGGVTVANAADYAKTGATVLVSSSPYYAKPKDVKVVF